MNLKLKVLRSEYKKLENQDVYFWVGQHYVMKNFNNSPIYEFLHYEDGWMDFLDIDTNELVSVYYKSKDDFDCIRERFVEVELFEAVEDTVKADNEFDKVSLIKLVDFMKESHQLSNLAYDSIKSFIKNA